MCESEAQTGNPGENMIDHVILTVSDFKVQSLSMPRL